VGSPIRRENKIPFHTAGVLNVQGHNNERIITITAQPIPKSDETCGLEKHSISIAFISFRLDFDDEVRQVIDGKMEIAFWCVAVVLALRFDVDNKLQRPFGATERSMIFPK
jgi:hypothetical protein